MIRSSVSFRKGGGLVDAADARIVRKKGKYCMKGPSYWLSASSRPRALGWYPGFPR
jgi:hypothetical protein